MKILKSSQKVREIGKGINISFLLNLIIICFSLLFYSCFFLLKIESDLPVHIEILKSHLKYNTFPNPPLYYLLVYILSLFFIGKYAFLAPVIILSIMTFWKFNIVKNYFNNSIDFIGNTYINLLTFSLIFITPLFLFNIDNGNFYLGKFTSTIWHNSTLIFSFPFSILLFLKSIDYIFKPSTKNIFLILFISVLIILSKPSFMFAYIPAFSIICFYKFKFSASFFKILLVFILLFLLLLLQKSLIYNHENLDKIFYGGAESKVVFAPFKVLKFWFSFSKYPILGIFESFILLFLLFFFFIFNKGLTKADYIELMFALVLLFISCLIFIFLAESGPRLYHANFYWQIPICIFTAYLVSIKIFIKSIHNNIAFNSVAMSRFIKFIGIVYSLFFLSGMLYIFKIIVNKNYS